MHQLVLNKQTNWIAICLLCITFECAANNPIGGIIEQSGESGSIVRMSGEELTAELETFRLASSTILSAITVAPSADKETGLPERVLLLVFGGFGGAGSSAGGNIVSIGVKRKIVPAF